MIGERDVVGPDVELPLPQPQHAAQHRARVDANPHVQVNLQWWKINTIKISLWIKKKKK